MEARQFDTLARALAVGRSRRSVVTRLATGFGTGMVAARGATRAGAQGSGQAGQGPACREEGHPCEGNQECCEGLVCEPSGPGAADRCTRLQECPGECPAIELTTEIVAARAFRLEVDCAFDEDTDQTTCECSAAGGEGDGEVTSIVVTAAATCAQVVGQEVEFVAGPGFGIAGYAAGGASLTLILAGNVEASGTAVHWCETAVGFVPAVGPQLVAVGDDVSDGTGAIVVASGRCGALQGDPAEIDWYTRCAEPAADLEFSLVGAGDQFTSETGTRRTNAHGRLRFPQLAPGAYRLEPSGDGWCRAECDSLNDNGEIVVEAGRRAHLWVFACG